MQAKDFMERISIQHYSNFGYNTKMLNSISNNYVNKTTISTDAIIVLITQ